MRVENEQPECFTPAQPSPMPSVASRSGGRLPTNGGLWWLIPSVLTLALGVDFTATGNWQYCFVPLGFGAIATFWGVRGLIVKDRDRFSSYLSVIFGALIIVASAFMLMGSALRGDRPRELAMSLICAGNLRQLHSASRMYEAQNKVPPPDLKALAHGWLSAPNEVLLCPAAASQRECDYFLMPSSVLVPASDANSIMLACDLGGNHAGKGRNVVFVDGHVRWFNEDEFQTLLAQPQKTRFAAALRQAEAPPGDR